MTEKEAFSRGISVGLRLAHKVLVKAVARHEIESDGDVALLADIIRDAGTTEFVDEAYEIIEEFAPCQ